MTSLGFDSNAQMLNCHEQKCSNTDEGDFGIHIQERHRTGQETLMQLLCAF